MKKSKIQSWSRLDNAAKIFPSTTQKANTSVFRFSCELLEEIEPDILQEAAEATVEEFPNFLCVMKKGLFWYYLEESDLPVVVHPDSRPVCSSIYRADKRTLLFEITYFSKTINLEVFHVLTDGTGAVNFLKFMVCEYIRKKYGKENSQEFEYIDSTASFAKTDDSFRKYYSKVDEKKKISAPKAYKLRGVESEDYTITVNAAHMSAASVLQLAHKYNTTLTVYLTALLIESIHNQMSVQSEKKDIVISVPVNLRKYFPSDTTKNFFGMIEIHYNYKERSGEFSDIVEQVDKTFKEELTSRRLAVRMNTFSALEHNPFIQMIPLVIKNIGLRFARQASERTVTAVISNVGRIKLPPVYNKYIKSFNVYASTLKVQLCLCSFGDDLSLDFTSAFEDCTLEQSFIRTLTSEGIEVSLNSNRLNAV